MPSKLLILFCDINFSLISDKINEYDTIFSCGTGGNLFGFVRTLISTGSPSMSEFTLFLEPFGLPGFLGEFE